MLHSPPNVVAVKPLPNIEDIRQLIHHDADFGTAQLSLMRHAVNKQQAAQFRQEVTALRATVDEKSKPTTNMLAKLGVGLHWLGQHAAADEYLSRAEAHAIAMFYRGEAAVSREVPEEAIAHFKAAAKLGFDEVSCELNRVGAIRACGRVDEAEKALRAIAPKAVSRADYSFQMGCIMADRGDTLGAVEYFERAVDMDPYHAKALFWLANENARAGNDDEAISLYERALSRPPFHMGTLLNLGLLYEDSDNLASAAFCYRRVLEYDPNHERALLYLKDIDSLGGTLVDEDSEREAARLRQLLAKPLSDFEISVRSRNCLVRLDVNVVGDLTKLTEQDLLGSRNFGETSLKELRELMESVGLKIGQFAESAKTEQYSAPIDLSPEQRGAMEMSISDLNLSVRAKKCMSRLNITTVGELIARSPDELLGTRNFGVTSLNELRAKLEELGLSLRND